MKWKLPGKQNTTYWILNEPPGNHLENKETYWILNETTWKTKKCGFQIYCLNTNAHANQAPNQWHPLGFPEFKTASNGFQVKLKPAPERSAVPTPTWTYPQPEPKPRFYDQGKPKLLCSSCGELLFLAHVLRSTRLNKHQQRLPPVLPENKTPIRSSCANKFLPTACPSLNN